jgi:non-ribosomal peptide synthase protein (TIGR01720 family)
MPYQGISSLWLRYLCQDDGIAHTMQSLPNHQIRFNYLGQRDSLYSTLLQSAEEDPGPTQHLAHPRQEFITCQVGIMNDQLHTYWEYSENIHRRETIETVARNYMEMLQVLIRRSKER